MENHGPVSLTRLVESPPENLENLQLYKSTVLIPIDTIVSFMSSVLEVKMINEGDDVKIVLPRSYFRQLGLERGDTLLVTVEEEKAAGRKKHRKAHN